MNDWIPALVAGVAAVATIIVAVVTGRSALAAQRLQVEQAAKAAADTTAATTRTDEGKLALSIALETRREHQITRGRLDSHEEWREALVNEWLPDHEERDRLVERELKRLDPNFNAPPWKPLPRLRRYVPPAEVGGG